MKLKDLIRDDAGNVLIVVIVVSMVVGSLTAVALETGNHADRASASDRNHDVSLGLAEAGIHEQISRIDAQAGLDEAATILLPYDGSTPQGSYHVETTRCPAPLTDPARSEHQSWCDDMSATRGYVIDANGAAGVEVLKRARHVRVALIPPELFPGDSRYTIFSYTSIDMNNNTSINEGEPVPGDIWANDSITLAPNVVVNGSVTSAQSWIDSSAADRIAGNVWSGGYHPTGHWALNLSDVGGWARASVTAPTDPVTCGGQAQANYTVQLGDVAGDVTTWGLVTGGDSGPTHQGVCTAAAAAKPLPVFTYSPNNYDQSTLHEFDTVAAFNAWVASNPGEIGSITGTFVINEPSPSQSNRVDLTGWNLGGDLTVITQAPIFTGGLSDDDLPSGVRPTLVLVSHYAPSVGTDCDVNQDASDCAIHVKNHLSVNEDGTCNTSTLIYADNGPVAIKNVSNSPSDPANICGSIVSEGILIKNNQSLIYDDGVSRVIGFGSSTYEIGRWEELPPS